MKNININKKFLIFFSLVLSLLFINTNNVKAYYEESDTIYSSTLKFNADDYYQDNLWLLDNEFNYNITGSTWYFINGAGSAYGSNIATKTKYKFWVEEGKTYYFGILNYNNTYQLQITYENENVACFGTSNMRCNFTANRTGWAVPRLNISNTSVSLSNIMLSNEPITEFHQNFKFGYIVSNNQSNAFTLQFIDNYNNNNTYTLTNNSSVYLPFQYLNKEVTFSYNVNQNVNSDINSSVNIKFTPIFSGTLKSNNTNVLKSTFTYVYNYIYYKNFKLSSYRDIYLDDMLEINYPTTNKDSKALTLTSVISPNNVISNFTSDIKQTSIIDKDTYFNGTNSLYSFNINTYMYNNYNGLLYSINFETINLGVVNSSVSNSFPTNTDNDLEIYNTCSGNIFQDFNCNVTNAVTWTIFNIPIIGPLIGFISNLIQLISQLVSALEWYESLGILFSIFILIMFIKILGILWKGKDE